MNRRKIIIVIIGVIILAGAIFLASQLSAPAPQTATAGQLSPSEKAAVVVDTRKIQNDQVKTYVNITGRLQPEDKIDIYSEVSGVLQGTGKPFKVGVFYRKGQVLLRINDDEARQNLLAQKNNFINALAQVVPDLKIDYPDIYELWRNYLLEVEADEPLPPLPPVETEQQKLFLTGRNVYTQYHNIQQLENRLDKYVIRAPFSGVITEVNINEGTLVRNMQKLGEFMSTVYFELEAAVSISEIPYVNVGDTVDLKTTIGNRNYNGAITRINEKVDRQTQTIKVFIRVRGDELKAGMYMSGRILAEIYDEAIEIPRESLIEPDRVFIVEDSTAKLQQVDVLKLSEEKAVVKGIPDGAMVITEERNASFEGTKVTSNEQES